MNLTRALSSIVPQVPVSRGLQRAPIVGASTVGRFQGVNGTMISEWDAESAINQAFKVNWAVYRCVTINAEKIASLPFRAGMDPDKPEDYNAQAPLAKLLGPPRPLGNGRMSGPNIDTTPNQLWAHAVAQFLVTGRFGWEIEWSGKLGSSKVIALWPLISQYLWPKPNVMEQPENPMSDFREPAPPPRYFSGFQYRIIPGAPKDLSWQQCFYEWRPGQSDWRQPESPLQAARLDIAGMVEQSIYDYAFLKNDAMPASLVVTQAFETKEQFEGFKAQWNYRYGGAGNAGKAAFLEMRAEDGNVGQMVDVKVLGQSARDSLADKRMEQKINAICMALGTPRSKLDSSSRTYDNASVEDETWENETIIPLAKRLQEAINVRLAPLVGREVGWFDLSSLTTQQGKSYWTEISPLDALNKGALSLNQFNLLVGQPRIADDRADEIRYLENPSLPERQQETDRLDLTVASAADAQDGNVQLQPPTEEPAPALSAKGELAALPTAKDKAPVAKDAPTGGTRRKLSSGIMVALMIDPATAQKIAVPDGEAPGDLHVTLGYLGKQTDDVDRDILTSIVADYAKTQTPLAGKIGGKGIFDTPDGWAVVGLVDAPGLDELRHGLITKLTAAGIPVANNHSFTPHVTIAYVDDPGAAGQVPVQTDVPLSWNAITVAWGANFTAYPMTARRMLPVGGERDCSPPPRAAVVDSLTATLDRNLDLAKRATLDIWERALTSLVTRQRDTTMSRLEGRRGKQFVTRAGEGDIDVRTIYEPEFWVAENVTAAENLYRMAMAVTSREVDEDFVIERGKDLSVRLGAVLFTGIGTMVRSAIEKGADVTESVRVLFDDFAASGVKTMARKALDDVFAEMDAHARIRAQAQYRRVEEVEAELLEIAAGAS